MTTKAFEDYTIYFLGSVTITASASMAGCGRVTDYGQELRVTEALTKINTDRFGRCWLDLVDDETGQIARFGKVLFRRGPWPEGVSRIEPGSLRWIDALDAARTEAHKIEDPVQRADRLRQLREEFGPAPATSRTLAHYAGDARG